MQVRFHGFAIKQGAVSLDNFAKYLRSHSNAEFPYRGESRLVYAEVESGQIVGLLLTARDQKKFCELNEGVSNFTVKVRQLRGKNRLVDFNFFVVDLKTGKGLYQVYRGSCGLTTFGKLMAHVYAECVSDARDAAIEAIGGETAKEKTKREVRQRFKAKLEFLPMFTRGDFQNLVSDMKAVNSISFSCLTAFSNEPWYVPAQAAVSNERHSIVFSKKSNFIRKIKSAVLAIASSGDYDGIAVAGLDDDGQSVTYHTGHNLDSFGRCEFDTIAEQADLDVSNITGSSIVARIRDLMGESQEYFQ